jgi:hypothetical protein
VPATHPGTPAYTESQSIFPKYSLQSLFAIKA